MNEKNVYRFNLRHILFIAAAAAALRILPLLNAINWTDMYMEQAIPVLKHMNIYSVTNNIFPYSPVSMFLPALCAKLSAVFNLPFYIIMRLPAILADLGIAVAIYMTLLKTGRKKAFTVGMLYALNPVSILITSFHGNLISIAVLASFLAYAVLLTGPEKNYRLSALLLGLAIGFRGYPILLLPLFLLKLKVGLGKKIEYAAYAIIPTAISFIPFLILDHRSVLREVFTYSGFPDYGPAAILTAVYFFKNNALSYGLPDSLLNIFSDSTKVLFFIAYIMLLLSATKKLLISSILTVFLAFYFIYTGISSQYFIWVLPFAFLIQDRMLKYYLIFATWALVNTYWVYYPYIIFGKSGPINLPLRGLLAGQIISLSLLWLFCLLWTIIISSRDGDSARNNYL